MNKPGTKSLAELEELNVQWKRWQPTETEEMFGIYDGDSIPSISIVEKWLQSSVVVVPALVMPALVQVAQKK
ncbi:hypothetical protein J6590_048974 [Homalodisca vitripennis]|nr:hypothetical protein J6590_048974 [Homalodisca vitripennis]